MRRQRRAAGAPLTPIEGPGVLRHAVALLGAEIEPLAPPGSSAAWVRTQPRSPLELGHA